MNFPAYLAGVADSDGCFCLSRAKRPNGHYSYVAFFSLQWTKNEKSKAALRRIKKSYGGRISVSKRRSGYPTTRRDIISWRTDRKDEVEKFLRDIIPHLLLKKVQAQCLLELFEGRRKNPRWCHWGKKAKPKKVWAWEERLYKKCRDDKKK